MVAICNVAIFVPGRSAPSVCPFLQMSQMIPLSSVLIASLVRKMEHEGSLSHTLYQFIRCFKNLLSYTLCRVCRVRKFLWSSMHYSPSGNSCRSATPRRYLSSLSSWFLFQLTASLPTSFTNIYTHIFRVTLCMSAYLLTYLHLKA